MKIILLCSRKEAQELMEEEIIERLKNEKLWSYHYWHVRYGYVDINGIYAYLEMLILVMTM